uniref:Peptidase M13 N-terminal domain-containing protein n=1 Tax=Photinus pyralis TaxID=7054 RepID=A0A1Y1MPR4_PHOPY
MNAFHSFPKINFPMENLIHFVSWKNLRRHIKSVVFTLVALGTILCIVIVALNTQSKEAVPTIPAIANNVCLAPDCVIMASKILNNMDLKIDPCTDFYSFTCGNFMKNTPVPADEYIVSSFQDAQKQVLLQLRNLLEERSTSKELLPFKLVKNFYKSCMNTTAIEADGLKTIKIILSSLNGWPVIEGDEWYYAKFDWKQAMYTLRNIGFSANYLIKLDVIIDLQNSSLRVISLDQADFGINRRNLINGFNDSVVQSYYNYMVDVAEILGANRSQALVELAESLKLEMELAKISWSPSQRQEEKLMYNPITVLKLQNEYPNTNWKKYIKYILDIPGFQVSDDDIVVLRIPKYLNDLEDLLQETSKRVQANYIMWRVLLSTTQYLNVQLRNRRLEFYKEVYGEQRSKSLWKECVTNTILNFWESLSNLYMRKHSHNQAKRTINTMFTKIGANFVNLIKKSKWMDNETKEHAYEKSAGMPYYTTHSDEMDDKTLLNFYSTVRTHFQTKRTCSPNSS